MSRMYATAQKNQ